MNLPPARFSSIKPPGTASGATRMKQALLSDPWGILGLVIVLIFFLMAAGVWLGWLGQDWAIADGGRWESASSNHWFGTNVLGQDIFERAVYGSRTAFEIGLVVSLASTLLGGLFGALAGWRATSWIDDVVLWIMGVLDSIPFYLFVAALAYALQGFSFAMHLAMILTFWTTTARLIRAEVMRLKGQDFVKASQAIGLPAWRIVIRHVLPNTMHILLVQGTLVFVAAVKTEVILSFLGLGVQDGVSWGLMLAESTQEVIAGHFGNFIAASAFLFTFLLGLILLSDAIQDALEPKLAKRGQQIAGVPA
ncbi:MAG TPA: ABC transporter permease [Xanthomonadales bacterium]|nr:ABC transporter permease [Xanthomonadales bacterium]